MTLMITRLLREARTILAQYLVWLDQKMEQTLPTPNPERAGLLPYNQWFPEAIDQVRWQTKLKLQAVEAELINRRAILPGSKALHA